MAALPLRLLLERDGLVVALVDVEAMVKATGKRFTEEDEVPHLALRRLRPGRPVPSPGRHPPAVERLERLAPR
jgi:hypothetical protein